MIPKRLTNFALVVHNAVGKGMLLFVATFLALVISNSSYSHLYEEFFCIQFSLVAPNYYFSLSVREWINDLLMAIFFFSVGMEIKRELLVGHLSRNDQRLLPLISACGGVIFPVLIFLLINHSHPENIRGWATPAATDIAFALGVLALFGKNMPASLRVFLTALAIIDDLIAILIIAFFYTDSLQLQYFWYVGLCVIMLGIFGYHKISSGIIYFILGAIMWSCIMASGIHATIAGVILGFMIPINGEDGRKPIEEIEKNIHPLVSYLIMPIFAFANSGIKLGGFSAQTLIDPMVMGIALGLLIGKQLGIFGSIYLLVKSKLASLPENTTLHNFYNISIICGIGFTMSLFIGILAFDGMEDQINKVKIGVITGSLLSFLFGILMLKISCKKTNS